MVAITYAVEVCDESRELRDLLKFLVENKNDEDDIHVLVDSGKVTPAFAKCSPSSPTLFRPLNVNTTGISRRTETFMRPYAKRLHFHDRCRRDPTRGTHKKYQAV